MEAMRLEIPLTARLHMRGASTDTTEEGLRLTAGFVLVRQIGVRKELPEIRRVPKEDSPTK